MIALDTNVLVRFLTRDDPKQFAVVRACLGQLGPDNPGFVGREVVVELIWVLERSYRMSRDEISEVLHQLIGTEQLIFEAEDRLATAMSRFEQGGPSLADQLIRLAGWGAGCDSMVTFDRELAKEPGVTLLG